MQKIECHVRERILAARIGSLERNILRFILGEIVTRKRNKKPTEILRSMLQINDALMWYYKRMSGELTRVDIESNILIELLEKYE